MDDASIFQGERLVIFSTHIIGDIEATATHPALLNRGRFIWTGTPSALLADAASSAWSLTIPKADFDRLRTSYRVSTAILRGEIVETRLRAASKPHSQAIPVTPTLEDAYLLLQDEEGTSKPDTEGNMVLTE